MKEAVLAAALTLTAAAAGTESLLGLVHCVCPVVPAETSVVHRAGVTV